jgi:type I restriction enzyme M protein
MRTAGVSNNLTGSGVATLDEVQEHRYALTPGRYVGAEDTVEDDEPLEEKMPRLVAQLEAMFSESARLEQTIRERLQEVFVG